jgi:hypothetical protein
MIAAQVCVFFLGGFETAATSMSFCLYELSLNQDVQRRLREEIDHVLKEHKGHFTYNALEQMEYLDHVVAGEYVRHWFGFTAPAVTQTMRGSYYVYSSLNIMRIKLRKTRRARNVARRVETCTQNSGRKT